MSEAAVDDLCRRWTARRPAAASREATVAVLQEHRAYQIPVSVMGELDLRQDEEVREDLVDSLWTITHPHAVAELTRGEARQHLPSADEADQYWRELFVEDDDEHYTVGYRLLTTQHALGHRVSVLLEREGDAVTHFKVYGLAPEFSRELRVMIGFPERRPHDPELGPFMRAGDPSDPLFVEYLHLLAESGRI